MQLNFFFQRLFENCQIYMPIRDGKRWSRELPPVQLIIQLIIQSENSKQNYKSGYKIWQILDQFICWYFGWVWKIEHHKQSDDETSRLVLGGKDKNTSQPRVWTSSTQEGQLFSGILCGYCTMIRTKIWTSVTTQPEEMITK